MSDREIRKEKWRQGEPRKESALTRSRDSVRQGGRGRGTEQGTASHREGEGERVRKREREGLRERAHLRALALARDSESKIR